MIEYPNVPGPELRRIMAGLKTDYRFYLCTMTFPDYCEDIVARMIEFGKPLGKRTSIICARLIPITRFTISGSTVGPT